MGSTLDDDDDDDERHQFTVAQKKAEKRGYALARTAAGYRLWTHLVWWPTTRRLMACCSV